MLFKILRHYAHWLHLQWPAGIPEKMPLVREDYSTNVPGVFVVGDLTGKPLLKFALDSGAQVAQRCIKILSSHHESCDFDVLILGAGVAGCAAAVELSKSPLKFALVESNRKLSTLVNFPLGKPIYTYPKEMIPQGDLQVKADSRESLLEELNLQLKNFDLPMIEGTAHHIKQQQGKLWVHLGDDRKFSAHRIIVALGRSGNYRRMGCLGEDLPKVNHRFIDPAHYTGKKLLIVGGGDSACEAAIACAGAGAQVTIVYRGSEFQRAKPENTHQILELATQKQLQLHLGTQVAHIRELDVTLKSSQGEKIIPNEAVLTLIGREPPLDFFRRSKMALQGENSLVKMACLSLFVVAIALLYGWKSLGWGNSFMALQPAHWLAFLEQPNPMSLLGVIYSSASSPSFWVTLLYSLTVLTFGIGRIRRRRTNYVRLQTLTLMLIQWFPLFILPEILLPYWGAHNLIPLGLRESLFPGDSWWRAYGFILAWPLMAWNVFTEQPNVAWLVISFVQTFVLIPLIVWRWGKGAYCGWICSCGALAETLGDGQREKMPHGKKWNRLNFLGQGVLASAVCILGFHILAWSFPKILSPHTVQVVFMAGYWKPVVDWLLAGVLGTGLYFWLSGRVWCRFACPLAAWMHICARFSRFRIFAEGKKCISCHACTSVCHQGIDVMAFASRGQAMQDPQCVRCSACVQTCPTQVLKFGSIK